MSRNPPSPTTLARNGRRDRDRVRGEARRGEARRSSSTGWYRSDGAKKTRAALSSEGRDGSGREKHGSAFSRERLGYFHAPDRRQYFLKNGGGKKRKEEGVPAAWVDLIKREKPPGIRRADDAVGTPPTLPDPCVISPYTGPIRAHWRIIYSSHSSAALLTLSRKQGEYPSAQTFSFVLDWVGG